MKKVNLVIQAILLEALTEKILSTHQLHQIVLGRLGDRKYGLSIYMTARNLVVLKKQGLVELDNQTHHYKSGKFWRLV